MMTRDECKQIRATLEQFLPTIEMPGYRLKLGNASFGETATFKLEVCPIREDGTVETKEAGYFRMMAKLYDMEQDDLGKQFVHNGRVFTVSGLNPKSQKAPILCTRNDGKVFKFPTVLAKACLAAPAGIK